MKKIAIITLLAFAVAGCASNGPNQNAGQVIGGISGAVLGSMFGQGTGRLAMVAIGAVAGTIIGGNIGKHMDDQDKANTRSALEHNQTGQSSQWHNPDKGATYVVTPTKTYEEHNRYCREYTTVATINGKAETVYGTACRQPDGSWQAVR